MTCTCASYPGSDEDSCSCCGQPIGHPCRVADGHSPAHSREEHRARWRTLKAAGG